MFTEFSLDWYRRVFDPDASVAVVANGPDLRGSNLGALIDAHDVVCRMNRYQIQGYEDSVGTKTSLYVTNLLFDPTPFIDCVGAVFVSRPFSRSHAYNVALGRMMQHFGALRGRKVCTVSEGDFDALYGLLSIPADDETGRNPTTGLTFLYALIKHVSPERISLLGFDFFASLDTPEGAYYFDKLLPDGLTIDAQNYYCEPDAERAAFAALVKQNPQIKMTEAIAEKLGVNPSRSIIMQG